MFHTCRGCCYLGILCECSSHTTFVVASRGITDNLHSNLQHNELYVDFKNKLALARSNMQKTSSIKRIHTLQDDPKVETVYSSICLS